MSREKHNRDRLTWWFNHDWPERIAGRFNSEQPMESRRLESRVIAKSGALDRIDAHYGCEQDHGRKPRVLSKALADTDRYLLDLVFGWLPSQGPGEIYYKAARQVLLSDSVAGGVVELERLEKLAADELASKKRENHKRRAKGKPLVDEASVVGEVAKVARSAFEKLLQKTLEDGYALEVAKDERARTNMEAYHQDRGEVARLRDEWARAKFVHYRTERRMSQPDAVKRLAEDYRRDAETIRAALRDTPLWNATLEWERVLS